MRMSGSKCSILSKSLLALFLFSNLLSIQKTENNTNKIDSILEIIHSDPFLKISINDLAKLVGTNESYLRQEFKEQVGITIGNYIKQTKIKEAKKMIIQKGIILKLQKLLLILMLQQ